MPVLQGIVLPDKELRYRSRSVPDSATDITTKSGYVTSIRFCNRSGTAATITLEDKDTTPFEFYEAVSIAANSVSNERISTPLRFVGGLSIQAGTADAITAEIFGWTDP